MAKTELATPAASAVEILQRQAESIPTAEGVEDVTESIIMQTLSARSLEELLSERKAPSFGEQPDSCYLVHGLRKVEGGLNPDLGFYLLIDATDENTGERNVYSSGATRIVAQLIKAHAEGWLPASFRVAHVVSKNNANRTIRFLVSPDAF